MLNLELGSPQDRDGRSCILTSIGAAGHAVFGPYEKVEPGRYAVRFNLELVDGGHGLRDYRCAVLDVASEVGNRVLARKEIYASQLRGGPAAFVLPFQVEEDCRLEYRIWVSGRASLLLDEYRPMVAVEGRHAAIEALLETHAFPGEEGEQVPFFRDNRAQLRSLYESGIGVRIFDGAVVLTVAGISLYARQLDDLNFVGEVFHERVYNFTMNDPVCVLDVGMNIGLSSLTFASQAEVVEINSFEPFRSTFDRAADNLELNPTLSAKIKPWNFGLSDHNREDTILVPQDHNSGGMSTVGAAEGIPIHVTLRDAAEVLEPIITDAARRGLRVVAKIDCEGSEFAIFKSLEARGLLAEISAFMVEWHAIYQDKDQWTLIEPLKRAGFVVFDRSPSAGNGFFYAVRAIDR